MEAIEREIPKHVRGLLSQLTIDQEGDATFLSAYPDRLSGADYTDLKKAIEGLGGKWRKGSKKAAAGYIFSGDAAEKIESAIATGSYVCPRLNGCFYTPPALADRVAQLANLSPLDLLLEPSAGIGDLLFAADHPKPNTYVYELLEENRRRLTVAGWTVRGADFLEDTKDAVAFVDRVIMNPPFGRGQDVVHVERAYNLLLPGGRLVAIISAAVQYRQDKKHQLVRDLIKRNDGSITPNDPEAFVFEGTQVRTVTIVIDKP